MFKLPIIIDGDGDAPSWKCFKELGRGSFSRIFMAESLVGKNEKDLVAAKIINMTYADSENRFSLKMQLSMKLKRLIRYDTHVSFYY